MDKPNWQDYTDGRQKEFADDMAKHLASEVVSRLAEDMPEQKKDELYVKWRNYIGECIHAVRTRSENYVYTQMQKEVKEWKDLYDTAFKIAKSYVY